MTIDFRSSSGADVLTDATSNASRGLVCATALPLTGIGGITAATAGEVIRAGAGGVAVAGAILAAADPAAAAQAIRAAVDQALEDR